MITWTTDLLSKRCRIFTTILFSLMVTMSFGVHSAAAAEAKPPIRSASEYDYPPLCVVDAKGHADGFFCRIAACGGSRHGARGQFPDRPPGQKSKSC